MKPSTRFATLLVILAVIFGAMFLVMPPTLSILDGRLYYGADEALAYLAKLGPRGRNEYFVHECIDLVFIVVYTLLLRALAERWRLRGSVVGWLVFAPGAADFLETTGILLLLGVHPREPRILAVTVGYFTLFKWIGFAVVTVAMQLGRLAREPR